MIRISCTEKGQEWGSSLTQAPKTKQKGGNEHVPFRQYHSLQSTTRHVESPAVHFSPELSALVLVSQSHM